MNRKIPKAPLLYLWIHYKIQEHGTKIMRTRSIIEIIRRNVRLPPKQFDYDIVKELEEYKLIERINKKVGYKINQNKYIIINPIF